MHSGGSQLRKVSCNFAFDFFFLFFVQRHVLGNKAPNLNLPNILTDTGHVIGLSIVG